MSSAPEPAAPARHSPDRRGTAGRRPVHLFVYGTLRGGGRPAGERHGAGELLRPCERVRPASVTGMLFDLGSFPALVLAGRERVRGEVWRCPPETVGRLDEYERVDDGLFRRVGVEVDGVPCWTYVAGPAIVSRLEPDRRIPSGEWRPDEEA